MSDFKKTDKNISNSRKREENDANHSGKAEHGEFKEKVLDVHLCAKIVKCGRGFVFIALVVVGDQKRRVGVGYGRAKEVPEEIRKGTDLAKKNITSFQLNEAILPHVTVDISDGRRVRLRLTAARTSATAGGGVRAIFEMLGVQYVLTKSMSPIIKLHLLI
jgi:small subunit ribosomal protein S5